MMTAFLLKSSLLHTPERLTSFIIKPSDQKKRNAKTHERKKKKTWTMHWIPNWSSYWTTRDGPKTLIFIKCQNKFALFFYFDDAHNSVILSVDAFKLTGCAWQSICIFFSAKSETSFKVADFRYWNRFIEKSVYSNSSTKMNWGETFEFCITIWHSFL